MECCYGNYSHMVSPYHDWLNYRDSIVIHVSMATMKATPPTLK